MRINWGNNYKLPLSFIIFFVLTFFLIGEQLPSLPTYLFGHIGGNGPDKVHILDLASGDALHRPVAYLIIGAVIWALFRVFTWPIAYFLGASLWILEQLTLTPLDQRPSIQNLMVFMPTFWILLTLVPYFIYKKVDQKWGGTGKRNAILIVLVMNLLLLGFFAYQIYILGHSYRGLSTNKGQQTNSIPGLPPNICPERMVTEKDKPTTAYLDGKILPVSGEVQNWVEANCPEALEQP